MSGNIFSPQIQIFEPFGAHVDPSRTNMSSKQLLQTVNSRMCDIPFVINKAYTDFTDVKSPFVLLAPHDGIILNNDYDILYIYYNDPKGDRVAFEYIPKMKKLVNNALTLRYKRPSGHFKKGDILFDYTGQTEEGLPKIGYRANIMFSSWMGFCAEDAFVMSESFSRRAQIDHGDKLYIPITKKFKYLKNSKGKYFTQKNDYCDKHFLMYTRIDPSLNMDSELINITEENSKYYINYIDGLEDSEVLDIKVHKINPAPFQEVAKEYIYSPSLIQEVASLYNDQYMEYKDMYTEYSKLGAVKDTRTMVNQLFVTYKSNPKLPQKLLASVAEAFNIIEKDIDYILEIDILQTVPTVLGDKFANCFAGKGTVSMIIPDKYMPIDEDGNRIDIIFNPLGIYGRNNWGTMFELGLSKIIRDVEKSIDDKDLTKEKLTFINENFIAKFDEEYYNGVNQLIENFDKYYEYFKTSVKTIGFYLCADNFPGIPYSDFYDTFIEEYAKLYYIKVDKQKVVFTKEVWEWLVKEKKMTSVLFGPNTFKDVDLDVFCGESYYLKLFHTAGSKYNSVAFAKTYNKSSGQPARGRAKKGAQHASWQTNSAGIGHSDKSSIIVELYTVKADCLEDKMIFMQEIIYNGKYFLKDKNYNSKTKETISHILQAAMGMEFNYTGDVIESSRETERLRIIEKKAQEEKTKNLEFSRETYNYDENDNTVGDNLDLLIQNEKDNDYILSIVDGY